MFFVTFVPFVKVNGYERTPPQIREPLLNARAARRTRCWLGASSRITCVLR